MKKILFLILNCISIGSIANAAYTSKEFYGPPALAGTISTGPRNWDPALTYLSWTIPVKDLSQRMQGYIVLDNPSEVMEIKPATQLYMGQGVFAMQEIPQNTIICEYTGEIVSEEVSSVKYSMNLTEGLCIDPLRAGNEGRYVNHSKLKANAKIVQCHVGSKRILFLATTKKIQKGQEIFFDYGDGYWHGAFRDAIKDSPKLVEKLKQMYRKAKGKELTALQVIEFAHYVCAALFITEEYSVMPKEMLAVTMQTIPAKRCIEILDEFKKVKDTYNLNLELKEKEFEKFLGWAS